MLKPINLEEALLLLGDDESNESVYFKRGNEYMRVRDTVWSFGDESRMTKNFLKTKFYVEELEE